MTTPDVAAAATPVALDRRDLSWWGMAGFIITEAFLFAYLLGSYIFLGAQATTWPPPGAPELKLVSINTALLILSSVTAIVAERGIRAGRVGRLRAGLTVSFVLGIIFLSIQGYEYTKLEFHPQSDAYGSLFFTITGMHGAHVFVGLLMLALVLVRSLLGHFTEARHGAVRNAVLYWHFVDVVWLVVFTILYLIPQFQ
jgi:heme/copper-type cytochrome/quinol oxidase subunit 3